MLITDIFNDFGDAASQRSARRDRQPVLRGAGRSDQAVEARRGAARSLARQGPVPAVRADEGAARHRAGAALIKEDLMTVVDIFWTLLALLAPRVARVSRRRAGARWPLGAAGAVPAADAGNRRRGRRTGSCTSSAPTAPTPRAGWPAGSTSTTRPRTSGPRSPTSRCPSITRRWSATTARCTCSAAASSRRRPATTGSRPTARGNTRRRRTRGARSRRCRPSAAAASPPSWAGRST